MCGQTPALAPQELCCRVEPKEHIELDPTSPQTQWALCSDPVILEVLIDNSVLSYISER